MFSPVFYCCIGYSISILAILNFSIFFCVLFSIRMIYYYHKVLVTEWVTDLRTSRTQGSGALPSPSACTVTQQLECWYTCWCGPAVQARCEGFGWLFCKAFDNSLWFYISFATVSCVCCCCKFGPSDCGLYWFTLNNGLDLSFCPQPVQKSSALPLVIVFPLGL